MKAYIFDLDGTIIDSLSSIRNVINDIAKRKYDKVFSYQEIKDFIGDGVKLLIERVIKSLGIESEKEKEEFLNEYLKAIYKDEAKNSVFFEGIEYVLSELKNRGKKIAVLTNKNNEGANYVLNEKLGSNYFEKIVGVDKNTPPKPEIIGIKRVLESLSVKNNESVYIGDSQVDMMLAKKVGMFAVGVLWGYRTKEQLLDAGADIVIEKPEQLLNIEEN